MLIKEADDKSTEITQLESLIDSCQKDTVKSSLTRDLAMLRSGLKGENSTAYHLDFYFRDSKNWMLIHDLRLEHNGQVAQIDHLLIGRMFDIYVIESKNFNAGIKINNQGEFFTFHNNRPVAVPSPIEQNERHIHFLKKYFRECDFLPKRLGFRINPVMKSVVLVAPNSHISRPSEKRFDTTAILKADMFKKRFEEDINGITTKDYVNAWKIMTSKSIETFAQQLVLRHKPLTTNYANRYNITNLSCGTTHQEPVTLTESNSVAENKEAYQSPSSGYFCANCKSGISQKVAVFCFNQKHRFGGRAYCYDCQKKL